jgi:hypothetical protein
MPTDDGLNYPDEYGVDDYDLINPKTRKEKPMSEFKFYVTGVKFYEAKSVLDEMLVGETLRITPEPTNKYDPNAVRLEYDSNKFEAHLMIGYVPKKFSAEVSALLEISDLTCTITELNLTKSTWEQIKVSIKETENG